MDAYWRLLYHRYKYNLRVLYSGRTDQSETELQVKIESTLVKSLPTAFNVWKRSCEILRVYRKMEIEWTWFVERGKVGIVIMEGIDDNHLHFHEID